MIVYDLECREGGHRFEGWFGSSDDYARQHERGLVTCPFCGSGDVAKAVMAPHVGRKGNQMPVVQPASDTPAAAPVAATGVASSVPATAVAQAMAGGALPPEAAAMLKALATMQAEALKNSTWVGRDFAEEARAMHYGEQDQAPIHGEASPDEARELIEEGIDVSPVLFPVVPPGKAN